MHSTFLVPVADGGEGTVEVIIAATQGAERHAWRYRAAGRESDASWGISSAMAKPRLLKWRRPVEWSW
ncbi:glycerate kinase [Shigella flexneri]